MPAKQVNTVYSRHHIIISYRSTSIFRTVFNHSPWPRSFWILLTTTNFIATPHRWLLRSIFCRDKNNDPIPALGWPATHEVRIVNECAQPILSQTTEKKSSVQCGALWAALRWVARFRSLNDKQKLDFAWKHALKKVAVGKCRKVMTNWWNLIFCNEFKVLP